MAGGKTQLAVGLALVLLVTVVVAGAVATSAAVGIELSDGDRCETGGASDVRTTATPENVTSLAANVTRCVAEGDGSAPAGSSPSGG